jgi:hypothetical protein
MRFSGVIPASTSISRLLNLLISRPAISAQRSAEQRSTIYVNGVHATITRMPAAVKSQYFKGSFMF